jgi:hypothetical protein
VSPNGHTNDHFLDFFADRRPARGSTCTRSIEFAGDELSVPAQSRHLAERLAAQSMADFAERHSLSV